MTSMARITTAGRLCLVVGLLSLAGTAQAQAPLFEVEKSDATKLLQVTDDAGFLVRGAINVGTLPAAGAGVRLMWYPKKAAFRAGRVDGSQWDEAEIGAGSVALGVNTTARGGNSLALNSLTVASAEYSIAGGYRSTATGLMSLAIGDRVLASGFGATALGNQTVASGSTAAALGQLTVASGNESFAAGFKTKAIGPSSAALGEEAQAAGGSALAAGFRTQALGNASMATGTGTVAAGAASVALGSVVTAQGDGSFAFGDRNTGFPVNAGPNEFLVRAFGGIGLNTGVNIGCDLPAGTGAWACTSSRLAKEGFEAVDGETMLERLATVPIQRWRYRGTEAAHLGPTAEDFHAAFGLGESATKIATVDANGVSLLAVQALERRTAALQAENTALRAETTELGRRLEVLEIAGRGR